MHLLSGISYPTCLGDFVITLSAFFLGWIRAFPSGLIALANMVTLTFGFARRFVLAKINFGNTNAKTLSSALVGVWCGC